MLFQTSSFLIFFCVFLFAYLLVKDRYYPRNGLLFLASYFFYGYWNWKVLGLILFSTVVDYYFGIFISRSEEPTKRKRWVWVSVVLNLSLLGVFKYYNFFVTSLNEFGLNIPILNLLLPIGISFYTFESISYIVDVYKRKIEPAQNFLEYAVFISFFPHLVAGPIIRPGIFFPSLRRTPEVTEDVFMAGFYRFCVGLAKKLILADLLALAWVDEVFANPQYYSAIDTLIATYGYAFQIYNDFSAYSDMAIGLAMILGIYLPENFNSPYVAANFQEFWKRWHISLSTWLKDYLYIPLGGGHTVKLRKYFNILVTMLLGGLWHGAAWTFVVWGALHGFFIIGNHLWDDFTKGRVKIPFIASWFLTFHLTCFAWIFFRSENFLKAKVFINRLMELPSHPGVFHGPALAIYLIALCLFFQFLSFTPLQKRLSDSFARSPFFLKAATASGAVALIIIFEQHFKPFIYFQF